MVFVESVWTQLSHAGIPEIISVIFGLASVIFAARESILTFPTGLVAVVIAAYIYITNQLYADFAIQIYYFVASVYGWLFWLKLNREEKSISNIKSYREWIFYILVTGASLGTLYFVLLYTDSPIPFSDSLVNSLFITGMILMALKRIENWFFWILGDIGSVFISYYKGLNYFTVQYFIFALLAAGAWYNWHKKLKANMLTVGNTVYNR